MSEKWKKTQNIKNKLDIVKICLAIILIATMLLIMYGLIKQEDLANMWDWSS